MISNMQHFGQVAYVLALHLVALVTSLSDGELTIIRNYSLANGRGGLCSGLNVSQDEQHIGFWRLSSSGIPNHPSYQITDRSMERSEYTYYIPETPYAMNHRTCLPRGVVGFAVNGVPFYSPLTDQLTNAVQGPEAMESDGCHGAVDAQGKYHYRELPALECLYPGWTGHPLQLVHGNYSTFIGVAIDGFPIYFLNTTFFNWPWFPELLDSCHGTHVFGSYRYYITEHFPYILGCLRGEVYGNLNQIERDLNLNMICGGMEDKYEGVCICRDQHINSLISKRNVAKGPTSPSPTPGVHIFSRRDVTQSSCHFPYSCDGPMYTDYCSRPATFKNPRDCQNMNKFGGNTCARRGPSKPGSYPPIKKDAKIDMDEKGSEQNEVLCGQKKGSAGILRISCKQSISPLPAAGAKPPKAAPNRPGSRPALRKVSQPSKGPRPPKSSKDGPVRPTAPASPPSPPSGYRSPIHLDGKSFRAGRPSVSPPGVTISDKTLVGPPGVGRNQPQGPVQLPPGSRRRPGHLTPGGGVIAPPIGYVKPHPPGWFREHNNTDSGSPKLEHATKQQVKPMLRTAPPPPPTVQKTTFPPIDFSTVELPMPPSVYIGPQPPAPILENNNDNDNGSPSPRMHPQDPSKRKDSSTLSPPDSPVISPSGPEVDDGKPSQKTVDEIETSRDISTSPVTHTTTTPSTTKLLPPPGGNYRPSDNRYQGPPAGYAPPRAPGTQGNADQEDTIVQDSTKDSPDGQESPSSPQTDGDDVLLENRRKRRDLFSLLERFRGRKIDRKVLIRSNVR